MINIQEKNVFSLCNSRWISKRKFIYWTVDDKFYRVIKLRLIMQNRTNLCCANNYIGQSQTKA